jgi:hypothetical protein
MERETKVGAGHRWAGDEVLIPGQINIPARTCLAHPEQGKAKAPASLAADPHNTCSTR